MQSTGIATLLVLSHNATNHSQTSYDLLRPGWPFLPPVVLCAGNAETLMTTPTKSGIDVRAAVADWHAKFYSANLMTAAVYGRHSLDELQQLVVECFSPVATQDLSAPEFPADVFKDEV